jgi:polysaccharide pyruvyl transferase WcaK-like protein
MKIVISGVTSFRNHGVEALVTTTLAQLRARLSGAEFLVLDRMPEYDAAQLKSPDVRFQQDATVRPLVASRLRRAMLGLSHFVAALGREYQTTRHEIQNAAAVIATGGDIFGSEYGHLSLLTHLAPLEVARAAGVPFFLHAQSIGPFKNDPDTRAFLDLARHAAHITVRERMSCDYLVRTLGLPATLVTLVADPAFLLARTEAPWRAHYRFDNRRPVVALTPSQAICNWMNSDYDLHLAAWRAVVDALRRDLDADIILVPHVQEVSPKNDDRILATQLLRHADYDPRIQIAGGDFTASDFKGIISQCDLVVSERMHACIAGLSSTICTVAIGYSIKAEGILCDLFDLDRVKGGLLLPLQDFLDPGIAVERVRRAWDMRRDVHARLKQTLPEVQRRAALAFDLIAQRLAAKPAS